jgi:hypothetical protein
MSSPDGQQLDQFTMLRDKARELSRAIAATFATEADAAKYYHTIVIPTLTYGNRISHLSEKQCNKLDALIRQTCIRKMGYKSSTPTSMIQGPRTLQGLGLTPLWSLQGTAQTMLVVEALRTHGPLNKMIRILLEWVHAFTGTTLHPIYTPNDLYPPLPTGWMSSLHEFMSKMDISIHFPIKSIPLRRQNDQILMDRAVAYTTTTEKLRNINHCRLFLQAETLSDLCTAQGDRLHPLILDQFSAQPLSRSTKFFPIQSKPGIRQWMHFTAFLRKTFCGNSRSHALSSHLGRWYPDHFCRRWNAYYHPVNKQIWIPWNPSIWHIHSVIQERHSVNFQMIAPIVQCRCTHPSDLLIPVDTFHGGLQFSLPKLSRRQLIHSSPDSAPPMNFDELISGSNEYIRQAMTHLVQSAPPPTCILHLEQPSIAIAINQFCFEQSHEIAFSWRIHSRGSCIWQNSQWIGGSQEPKRGYASGLLNILQLIQLETQCFRDITRGKTLWIYMPDTWVKHRLDTMLLHHGHWHKQIYLSPHFDVLDAIISAIVALDITVRIHTGLDSAPLTHAYKEALIDCKNFTVQVPRIADHIPIPSCPASLFVGRSMITANERNILRQILPKQNLLSYYSQKFKWPPSTTTDIDWDAREKAATKLKRWKFTLKLSCAWLPTNHHLHQIEGIAPSCSLCSQDETIDHLFLCPGRHSFRATYMQQLRATLQDLRTPFEITSLICTQVTHLFDNTTSIAPNHPQTNIGWTMFLRGFLSVAFRSRTPKYWSQRINLFLLAQAHALWTERCDQNNAVKIGRESLHVRNRLRAKVQELYDLADPLPATIHNQYLPQPMEDFLSLHPRNSILLWYATTKPALVACLRRFQVGNDKSRLPPCHPSNEGIPPDKSTNVFGSHYVPPV